jgi:hypothetical protein
MEVFSFIYVLMNICMIYIYNIYVCIYICIYICIYVYNIYVCIYIIFSDDHTYMYTYIGLGSLDYARMLKYMMSNSYQVTGKPTVSPTLFPTAVPTPVPTQTIMITQVHI